MIVAMTTNALTTIRILAEMVLVTPAAMMLAHLILAGRDRARR